MQAYYRLTDTPPCVHYPSIMWRFVIEPHRHSLVRLDKLSETPIAQGNQCILAVYCGLCEIMYHHCD